MACGDLIEVDETGEQFWIPKHRVPLLTDSPTSPIRAFQPHSHMFGKTFPLIVEFFKKADSLELESSYKADFHKHIDSVLEVTTKKHLVSDLIPLIGIRECLDKGDAWVLDVGCGRGTNMTEAAFHFPNSFFVGIDLSLDAVRGASHCREEANEGLENLSFYQMDVQNLKKDWNEKFDWVTIFNACHDQPRPDVALKEIYRVLKKNGIFSMIETDCTGNVFKDKTENEIATFFYGSSLFGSFPVRSNAPDAMVLGAMWGREKAQDLLKNAGFSKIETQSLPFMKGNVLYVCRK